MIRPDRITSIDDLKKAPLPKMSREDTLQHPDFKYLDLDQEIRSLLHEGEPLPGKRCCCICKDVVKYHIAAHCTSVAGVLVYNDCECIVKDAEEYLGWGGKSTLP